MGQLEHEHVDMVVFNRYVAPATRLEVDIAQHLALCEGHVPGVVPRHGKIGSLLAQVDIVGTLFAFGYHSQIIGRGNGGNGSLFVFTVGVEG